MEYFLISILTADRELITGSFKRLIIVWLWIDLQQTH